jgi:hypothetical protein
MEKNKISEQNVAELRNVTEDYEVHKKQCDKLYDALEDD